MEAVQEQTGKRGEHQITECFFFLSYLVPFKWASDNSPEKLESLKCSHVTEGHNSENIGTN